MMSRLFLGPSRSTSTDTLQQNCVSHNASGCEEHGGADVGEEGGGEQTAEDLSGEESISGDSKCLPEETEPLSGPAEPVEEQTSAQEDLSPPPQSPEADPTPNSPVKSSEENISGPSAGTHEIPEQELFNSFHYWRTPIPDIDLDLLKEEEEEIRPSNSSAAPALGRKQLEELIENLEPHIDDPDVKGEPVIDWHL